MSQNIYILTTAGSQRQIFKVLFLGVTRTTQASTLLINTTAGSMPKHLWIHTCSMKLPLPTLQRLWHLHFWPSQSLQPPSDFHSGSGRHWWWSSKLWKTNREKLLRVMEDMVHSPREHEPNEKLPFFQKKSWQERAVRPSPPLGRPNISEQKASALHKAQEYSA